MSAGKPLIALVSATPVAIPPATAALAEHLAEARVWNLLDDRLLRDAADAGGLTPALEDRMRRLIEHAALGGADGILLTCSLYGRLAHEARAPIPVLAPDDAVFAEALDGRHASVLVVASLASALEDSIERLEQAAADRGRSVRIRGALAADALDAAATDDVESLVDALERACRPFVDEADAVLLAQFSLAPAKEKLSRALGVTVLSGPASAAVKLRELLGERPGDRSGGALGALADDYTGATDVALAFGRAGLRTLLFFGVPEREVELPPHDAVVIALKSRTIPAEEAVAVSLAAQERLADLGAGQVYFKYCSTFDSTPRGNIGPVLDALRTATGANAVVTTPSSPEHGRTVYAGKLFVNGELLEDSPMARHPLTPMTDSDLPQLLRAQSSNEVVSLPLAAVRAGASALRSELERAKNSGAGYLVADAVESGDLRALAQLVIDDPLVAGAAGLAAALAETRVARVGSAGAVEGAETPEDPVGQAPAAVLAGSCSSRTLEQIADFREGGHPSFRLDGLSATGAEELAARALDWADSLSQGVTPLFYSSLPAEELRRVQDVLGVEASAALFEDALARIAVGLVERGVRRLISAGGETSGAIVRALRIRGVRVGSEVGPGVPWIYTWGDRPMALLLKSGNFGDPRLFSRAVDGARGWGVRP